MRIRNIKPEFFKNEELGVLDPFSRLCFIGLWCLADRQGVLEDRPLRIKQELFPYDNVNVEGLIDELEQGGFVARYEAAGKRWVWIVNFVKHQWITGFEKRKKAPLSPLPPPSEQQHNNSATTEGQQHNNSATTEGQQCNNSKDAGDGSKDVGDGSKDVVDGSTNPKSYLLKGEGGRGNILLPPQPAVGNGEGKWEGWCRAFRECHDDCGGVPEMAIIAAIRTNMQPGTDVDEAIQAFGRQMAGARVLYPVREFEKYLRRSAGGQKKEKTAVESGPRSPVYVPLAERGEHA